MIAGTTVIWVAVPLGVSILLSYCAIRKREYLGSALEKRGLFWFWAVSAGLTALSWCYLMLYWLVIASADRVTVWGLALEAFYDYLFAFALVFLLSALTWAPFTVLVHNNKIPRWTVTLSLWVTAAASFAFFVAAAGTRSAAPPDTWHSNDLLCSLAGGFIAFHHLTWDAIVWDQTWPATNYNPVGS
jgi:hypothetical protein